jgi:hypothetical protein
LQPAGLGFERRSKSADNDAARKAVAWVQLDVRRLKLSGIRFADTSGTALVVTYGWVTALLMIAFLCPNTPQIMARMNPVLEALGTRRMAVSGLGGSPFVVGVAAVPGMGDCRRLRGLCRDNLDHTSERIPLLAILR